MRILFTGRGSSGSWTVRGQQLGIASGGIPKPKASIEDCSAADVIVAVKRVDEVLLHNIRKSGKPWLFDAVDFYPQPTCSTWSKEQAIRWVRGQIKRMRPDAVIWPNHQMMTDCGSDGDWVIYHHANPNIVPKPVREQVKVVGYQGSPPYIGGWLAAITDECQRRGWEFRMNPDDFADLDIVLAIRDENYAGYAQTHWKSNVKLANAQAAGRPLIATPECGYTETDFADGVIPVTSAEHIRHAFDFAEMLPLRKRVASKAVAPTLEQCAAHMRVAVSAVKRSPWFSEAV